MNENLKIHPLFPYPEEGHPSFDIFISSIERLIGQIVPPIEDEGQYFAELSRRLPIVHHSPITRAPGSLAIGVLCSGHYTHGTGRFVSDMCSRYLVPGKQLALVLCRSMGFSFQKKPDERFFVSELIVEVQDEADLPVIQNNLPGLIHDIRMCILAVQHVRQLVQLKPLTFEQREIIFQENLASLLERPSKDQASLFDQAHHLIMKALGEEKVQQIHEQISPHLKMKPHTFDRDIYAEMQHFLKLFKDAFVAIRETKHIKRLISYQYLFRKILDRHITKQPKKRHLSVKILRADIQGERHKEHVLGILVGLNLIDENEIFDERHLFKAIQSTYPNLIKVTGSQITDRREGSPIRTVYLEVRKKNGLPFTQVEIGEIRKRLPKEMKNRIETVVHPIFMHRNEEEIMRGVLALSEQLTQAEDIPQVMIGYHMQSKNDITFIVTLLRLRAPESEPLRERLFTYASHLKTFNWDTRIVGVLDKMYPKEANVFEVKIDKKPFLRTDFSIDLYKARGYVMGQLNLVLGELRDYNGGMITKQHEVLAELKTLLLSQDVKNDFLVENFFYSITPAHTQSVLSPILLKTAFLMLQEVLDYDYQATPVYSSAQTIEETFILVIGSQNKEIIDSITHSLTDKENLTYSNIGCYDIQCVCYFYRFEKTEDYIAFREDVVAAMTKKPVPSLTV